MIDKKNKISSAFYRRDVHLVAKELLGKYLVRKLEQKYLTGMIVEVEAYDGSIDESSHSFRGRTERNEVMFRGGGLLYVYFTYGMHFCANVVTGKKGDGKAILIRALEPVEGLEEMSFNRFGRKEFSQREFRNLTNGPAKICRAFGIGRKLNGIDLGSDEIFILKERKIPGPQIVTSTRIGIKKSVDLPWRYYIKDNPFVSKI
ncbi:MAG: 3-methyladenine DNA glycosylase [Ignavibacteriae bacterium HGW-Ignavibacteriae-3]|nr:MAG: 3-methyladenine DNA glycosylase [Ignavibacteriae bacterium HGW-Ignavibacteriae-3]